MFNPLFLLMSLHKTSGQNSLDLFTTVNFRFANGHEIRFIRFINHKILVEVNVLRYNTVSHFFIVLVWRQFGVPLFPIRVPLFPIHVPLVPLHVPEFPIRVLSFPNRVLSFPTRVLSFRICVLSFLIRVLSSPTRILSFPIRVYLSPIRVYLSPIRVHLLPRFVFTFLPFVFHSCSLMFTRVHSCSIRVHSCSIHVLYSLFVFTRVPSVFPSAWCFRSDLIWGLAKNLYIRLQAGFRIV